MIEPIVQDYVKLALDLDQAAFCRHINVAVLVAISRRPGQSFQLAKTRMLTQNEQDQETRQTPHFDHRDPVLEIRKERPGESIEIWLGRSEENDLVIDEEEVSGRHAVFRRDRNSEQVLLYDLESTNGTTVNGVSLISQRPALLCDGDRLSFGGISFLFFSTAGFYQALRSLNS